MALPAEVKKGLYINRLLSLLSTPGSRAQQSSHSQFTGNKVYRYTAWYNCTYVAAGGGARTPCYRLSKNNPRNFLYVGNIQGGVAVGIVPKRTSPFYVYSDNYGGCEWQILARKDGTAAAFLHVYKGAEGLANYTLGGNWELRGKVESSPVAKIVGQTKNIISFAYVASGWTFAECCMLATDKQDGTVDSIYEYKAIKIS
ncbi:hypothetical protein [Desulfosarcina ovata]|uniref:Uncharacterized protein n=2 Tax=Desulfosarcina ovata TaxID=83564 RepID=A0A5K8AMN7_9BACT|nr:hypothetical protein [Desulfosarcina ovata]BBO86236.1 hypothetical protein DSCO28_68020 [Desulfosarcina ovata subsp. sediminis]BBO93120.1 hypothetical protein DSCOOX_63000 [Desulfosarcina ovata subsp. ovata]